MFCYWSVLGPVANFRQESLVHMLANYIFHRIALKLAINQPLTLPPTSNSYCFVLKNLDRSCPLITLKQEGVIEIRIPCTFFYSKSIAVLLGDLLCKYRVYQKMSHPSSLTNLLTLSDHFFMTILRFLTE